MNNKIRVILSALIAMVVVSLLYLVVDITPVFIVSHIFAIIAILIIMTTLLMFNEGSNKVPQAYAFIAASWSYAAVSIIFSLIACLTNIYVGWAFIIHIAILAVFGIRFIALRSGNEHIAKLDVKTNNRKAFEEKKKNYWK